MLLTGARSFWPIMFLKPRQEVFKGYIWFYFFNESYPKGHKEIVSFRTIGRFPCLTLLIDSSWVSHSKAAGSRKSALSERKPLRVKKGIKRVPFGSSWLLMDDLEQCLDHCLVRLYAVEFLLLETKFPQVGRLLLLLLDELLVFHQYQD